ncbi:hypothetical protein I4641_11025 [Waterburya agarophytonicola K14]|uniref:Uncharacterized protein n=1 Tax=Waterburya agarophytonicola KI4 TaxID=2874699 RepID=A0A964BQF2_9CYAN|nr:hypothetical protein [Waterburya agarophytonicola]MCC0177510.1 hypothetical protein [Waterburya agarophytonicola KI4]
MESNSGQLDELIDNLVKSKNYLDRQVEFKTNYPNLIDTFNSRIEILQQNNKPTIKIVSSSANLEDILRIKAKAKAKAKLRSLYSFEVVCPINNIYKIADNCSAIFLFYLSDQKITPHHQKLIDLATKRNISLFILVKQEQSENGTKTLAKWIESQEYKQIYRLSFPFDDFFDLNSSQHIDLYLQFLINLAVEINRKFVCQHSQDIVAKVEQFFSKEKKSNWQNIKQLKEDYLQGKEINDYRQFIINKTFNKINQQQQQKILYLKQKINQSRSNYLNLFIPDSWLFEIQQLIDSSQIELVKEANGTYLYLTINNSEKTKYIHDYILEAYQYKITQALAFQWSKINHVYGEGGLNTFIDRTKAKLSEINLLQSSAIELLKIDTDTELVPQLNITDVIDPYCLQLNSRILFDYNYIQGSWLKLLIFVCVGTIIYLISKLYFGTGIYIGFFILIFQLTNILTGQNIKTLKLKQHQKDLQRTVNNRYQNLVRLIVDHLINTLIISLDRKNQAYQHKIDAISDLAHQELDRIKQDIDRLQVKQNRLEQDRIKIKSWFD